MPIYVKDGGTWREISSSAGTQLYVRDGTSFTNKTIINAYLDRINTRKYDYIITSNDKYHIIKITLKNTIGRA